MLILIELHPFYFRPLLQLGKIFLNSIPAVQSACRSSAGIKIVCTLLSKSWIKVSYNTFGGDPWRALFDSSFHSSTEPLESRVYRVVIHGGPALYKPCSYKNVMQDDIKSATNFMTIFITSFVFFLYEAP